MGDFDSSPTRPFRRQDYTRELPRAEKFISEIEEAREREAIRKNLESYKPGPVMKTFGWVVSILLALFFVGIIAITFAFILVKYYNHLFDGLLN